MIDDKKIHLKITINKFAKEATLIKWGMLKWYLFNCSSYKNCLPEFNSQQIATLPNMQSQADTDAKHNVVKMNNNFMAILMAAFLLIIKHIIMCNGI